MDELSKQVSTTIAERIAEARTQRMDFWRQNIRGLSTTPATFAEQFAPSSYNELTEDHPSKILAQRWDSFRARHDVSFSQLADIWSAHEPDHHHSKDEITASARRLRNGASPSRFFEFITKNPDVFFQEIERLSQTTVGEEERSILLTAIAAATPAPKPVREEKIRKPINPEHIREATENCAAAWEWLRTKYEIKLWTFDDALGEMLGQPVPHNTFSNALRKGLSQDHRARGFFYKVNGRLDEYFTVLESYAGPIAAEDKVRAKSTLETAFKAQGRETGVSHAR